MWWTSTCSRDPHSSQVSARSRFSSSDRSPHTGATWSLRTALVLRASEMPPHCATSGFFPLVHLRHADTKFVRQCGYKRSFHHPFETVELVAVDGQLIVFRKSPKFLLVLGDDAVHSIIGPLFSVGGLAVLLIGGTFCFDHVHRDL